MSDFFLSVRNVINENFGDDPAEMLYLRIDESAPAISPADKLNQNEWVAELIKSITTDKAVEEQTAHINNSDILIYIHGYNDSENDILKNHRLIKAGLNKAGYKGEVVGFDWPCGNTPLAYLPDRHKAMTTAMQLVNGGIALLAKQQSNNCTINIHLLAHSTGAFVVREAFADADDCNSLPKADWLISQLIFISGDISSSSMDLNNKVSSSIYNHCVRFTNYFNPYDAALALSNVKRAGFDNRVGRVGLPVNVPEQCVNVNCGPYYHQICQNQPVFYSHSWYFTDGLFYDDLYHTIGGLTDRNYMDSRLVAEGKLFLKYVV